MNSRLALALAGLLVVILVAARGRASRVEVAGVDAAALQVRVQVGEGATVPPELAAAMRWPAVADDATPAEIELGRLLFFDPILSSNNALSCASCHHPDFGLADGQARSVGVSGVELPRSAPSLWNVGLRAELTWDGRASSLQNQMLEGPLFHPDEMAEQPEQLLAELAGNEEYTRLFQAVYGAVTLDNMARAIAAFQRTLVSRDSPFDRFAAGEFYALTGAQRRGLTLFRDPRTNCIRCHELPTFSTDGFKVIGVGDGALPFDAGRGAITGDQADIGAFTVPTLRNVALSAPYMHNGIEPELGGVISFYLNGGGDNLNIPPARLDPDLRSFNVPTRSLKDLEAFLLALTDESALPAIPDRLPSGLPPIAHRDNPARERVQAASALPRGAPRTHRVAAGQSIQAAIDMAQPGDTVQIEPGRYFEALIIDVAGLTIRGKGAVLVGRSFTPTALTVLNNDVTLIGLEVADFRQYTIDLQGANTLHLEDVILNGQRVSAELASR